MFRNVLCCASVLFLAVQFLSWRQLNRSQRIVLQPNDTTLHSRSSNDRSPIPRKQERHTNCTVNCTIWQRFRGPPPCVSHVEYSRSTPSGLLYVKLPKAASSTCAGVARRIAHHWGSHGKECHVEAYHARARNKNYRRRIKPKSFLWTVIRNPVKRALSEFFHFKVSREGVQPTEQNIREAVTVGNLQMEYIVPMSTANVQESVDLILQEYDFVGLVERFDESMVMLKLLLNLKAGDVIYLSAKGSNGYDDGAYQNKCIKIQPSFIPPNVQQYLLSEGWRSQAQGDLLLYEAVNRSLDATIEQLGRATFDRALAEHRELRAAAESACADLAIWPCSKDGQRQEASKENCYPGTNDDGCGYPCLDEFVRRRQREAERRREQDRHRAQVEV